jgi:DNA-binding PadR family transcriptional regulator
MGARTDGLSRSAFLVLFALADQPRHGLAIIDWIADSTKGQVKLGPGTLYGTLQKLLADGLIREAPAAPDPDDDDPRRRYYTLTPRAKRELKAEAARMRTLVDAAVARGILEA